MKKILLELIESDQDKELFTEIYQQHHKSMLFVAYKVIQNRATAEDIVHQAFIRVIKNFEKIKYLSEKKLLSLLLVITKNTAIDFYRQDKAENKKRKVIKNCISDKEFDEIVENEKVEVIYSYIQKMNEIYRDSLMLKYYYGFSNQEISNLLNLKIGSVNIHIHRGKQQLLHLIREG